MKRIGIFVIYSPQRILYKSTQLLFENLKEVITSMVVVVNGTLTEENINYLRNNSAICIVRENSGFDLGAYKCAMNDIRVRELINISDELVFCNDTFWGPFDSFGDMFDSMQQIDCDFWGINEIHTGLFHIIQSYFLVFRKKILMDKVLESFFSGLDCCNTNDLNEVLVSFEQGLYKFLTDKNYIPSALHKNPYVNLLNTAPSLWQEKIPVLKKKIIEKHSTFESLLSSLKYVCTKTKYPISIILDEIEYRYGKKISIEDIMRAECLKDFVLPKHRPYGERVIGQMVEGKDIYIYGCGLYARMIYSILQTDYVRGFIQTNKDREEYLGKKVYSAHELLDEDITILLGLNYDNTQEVLLSKSNMWEVVSIWEC